MIVIVDYGMGNLASIGNMIKKIGGQTLISSRAEEVERASQLILPGVGAFDQGMRNLKEAGLLPVLNKKVLEKKTPILGICLGLQLFMQKSEEGHLPGLGWIEGETIRFKKAENNIKIPHMGWNTVKLKKPHPYFAGLENEPRFYFVHSYHVLCKPSEVIGETDHGYNFTSAAGRENIIGVQFHPEKSHAYGMRFFRNLLNQS